MPDIIDTLSSVKDRLSGTSSGSTPSDASTGSTDSSAAGSNSDSSSGNGSRWREVDSPIQKTLTGVVATANGPYAVGTGGKVLHRSGGSWTVVIEEGPATRRNKLTCVAATDDGKRIWFAGSSGALGMYDTASGRKYDHTAPKGKTSTWEAIAVGGETGDERLRIANGSGEVLSATVGADGCPTFHGVVKPGSGSTIPALDYGSDAFYAVDTSGNVFEEPLSGSDSGSGSGGNSSETAKGSTPKTGQKEGDGNNERSGKAGSWRDIGVENAQVNFFDVDARADSLLVAGGGGRVYRYDRACRNWTPVDAGTGALRSLAREDATVVAVGANGKIFDRRPNAGWLPAKSPVTTTLQSVALGETDVAVGSGGTIIERR